MKIAAAIFFFLLSTVAAAAEPLGKDKGGVTDEVDAPEFSCGKRYCKEMSSCAEARFYVAQCHAKHFDRDGDGVPCENVCGNTKKRR